MSLNRGKTIELGEDHFVPLLHPFSTSNDRHSHVELQLSSVSCDGWMVSDGKWVGNVSIDFLDHRVVMKKDQSSFDEVEYFGGLDDSTWFQYRSTADDQVASLSCKAIIWICVDR